MRDAPGLLRIGLWVGLATGCGPFDEPSRSGDRGQGAAVVPPAQDRLAELADAMDPGELPRLSAKMPTWLGGALQVPDQQPAPTQLLATLREPVQAWDKLPGSSIDTARLQALIGVARGIVIAERAARDGASVEVLLLLERMYAVVDNPVLSHNQALMSQMLQMFAAVAAERVGAKDQKELERLAEFVRSALRRAGPLHRATVAEILRRSPDHDKVPDVLARASRGIRHDNDELSVGAMALSLELRGPKVTPEHRLELAQVCFEALELPCGDAARAQAAKAGAALSDATEKRLKAVDTIAKGARRAVELAGAETLDAQLERGGLLFELGRHADAKKTYESALQSHPRDARAVTGLARIAIQTRLDFQGARKIVDAAGDVENADRAYYEVAIGARATTLAVEVPARAAAMGLEAAVQSVERPLGKLRGDIAALEKLGDSKAPVLKFVLGLGDRLLPLAAQDRKPEMRSLVRGLLPDAIALYKSVPSSYYAYEIMLSAAAVSPDRVRALQAVEMPLPTNPQAHDAARYRLAQAELDLAIGWGLYERIGRARKALEAIEGSVKESSGAVFALRANTIAAEARIKNDAVMWKQAAEIYNALIPETPDRSHAPIINNLAVAFTVLGQTESALKIWPAAIQLEEDNKVLAWINFLVTRAGPDDRKELTTLAESADQDAYVRILAARWLAHLSDGAKTKKKWRNLVKRLTKQAKGTRYWPTLFPGSAGVVLRGSLAANISYGGAGLTMEFDVTTIPWLMMMPPS